MKEFTQVSASQIVRFLECQRKWYAESLLGLRAEQKPGASLGDAIHKAAEGYLQTGKVSSPNPEVEALILAAKDADLYPEWGRVFVEEPIEIELSGVKLRGRIDFFDVVSDADIPEVGDHKSLKWIKFAKEGEDLADDPQMVTYGIALLSKLALWGMSEPERVRLTHIYYPTQGPPRPFACTTTTTPAELRENWKKLGAVVEEMKVVAKIPTMDKVRPTWSACSNFGGCHLRDKCQVFKQQSLLPQSEEQPMASALDVINRLKAQAGTTKSDSTPPPATPTPPPAVSGTAQDIARRLMAKHGVTNEGGVPVIVPPQAPQEGLVPPDASPEPARVAEELTAAQTPAPVVSEPVPDTSRPSGEQRRPPHWRKKLDALHWTDAQVARLSPVSINHIVLNNVDGRGYSILADGTLHRVEKAQEEPAPRWYYNLTTKSFEKYSPTSVPPNDGMLVFVGDDAAHDKAERDLLAEANGDTVVSEFLNSVVERVSLRASLQQEVPFNPPAPPTNPPAAAAAPQTDEARTREWLVSNIETARVEPLILYVDCLPMGRLAGDVVPLSTILAPYMDAVAKLGDDGTGRAPLPHYSMVGYAQGPARVVGMMLASGLPSGGVYVDTRQPLASAALEVLEPNANVIIRRV